MASMFPWSNPMYASVCFSAYRLQPLLLSLIDECELSSASFVLHLLTCTLSTGRYWVSGRVLSLVHILRDVLPYLFPETCTLLLSLLHFSLTSPLNLFGSVIPQFLFSPFWWDLPRFQTVLPHTRDAASGCPTASFGSVCPTRGLQT